MSGAIEFPPLNNGLDFLASAIEQLTAGNDARNLKYAVLHLAAGVEVLLKYRLQKEHWTLVVADPDKVDKMRFAQGDFISVSATQAIERLRKVAGLDIGKDDIARVRAVQQIRNKLQHFGLTDSANAVEAIAADALDVLRHFINIHIYPQADAASREVLDEAMPEIQQGYGNIRQLVTSAMNRIEPLLDEAGGPIVECPICRQAALVIEDETGECKFCGASWAAPEDAASEYAWHILNLSEYEAIKDGGEMPTHECPSCLREALVHNVLVRGKRETASVCFACGEIHDAGALGECTRCGRLITDSDMTICSDCMEDIVGRD